MTDTRWDYYRLEEKAAEARDAYNLEIERAEQESEIDQRDLEELEAFWQRCDDKDAELEDAA